MDHFERNFLEKTGDAPGTKIAEPFIKPLVWKMAKRYLYRWGWAFITKEVTLMPEDLAGRNFFRELASLIGSAVAVTTTQGKTYTGEMRGYDPSSLSVCLASAKDGEGKSFHRLVINGSIIGEIAKTEEPFDLKTLANEIQRIFPPGEVKYMEDARVIQVLDKIKVTESGVEGSGPLTERVKTIFDKFAKEKGKK